MGYQLKVSTDDVAAKASAVRTQATELESQVAALTSQMGALAETWTGTASSAFQALYAEWKGQASQIQQSLASISASLATAGTNYAEVEAANAAGFSR
jgi:early secretory antigenic target protein ESAT-6